MQNIKDIIYKVFNVHIDDNALSMVSNGVNGNKFKIYIDKKKFFLKIYPNDEFNRHDRIKSELSFINFLKLNNLNNFPEIISHNRKENWIIFDWIEGTKIKNVSRREVKNLIDFLIDIQSFKIKEKSLLLPIASEACFSLVDHQSLIYQKAKNTLSKIQLFKNIDKDLIKTINTKFSIMLNLLREIKNDYYYKKEFWENKLNSSQRCISPSDVGFHNILNSSDKFIFFDFEFAGIDDPCKLIVDLIIQPDYPIPFKYTYLIKDLINLYKNKIPFLEIRLKIIFQLYQIKWFCIILNPIIKNAIDINTNNLYRIFTKSELYFERIEKNKLEILNSIDLI